MAMFLWTRKHEYPMFLSSKSSKTFYQFVMATPISTIKVLMVAINDYPYRPHRLNGCLNDLKAFKSVLQERYNTEQFRMDIRELTNENATRNNVIQGFLSHFTHLKKSDICLFYFSGHGSQALAPKKFWHNTPNRKMETLVCFDSRQPGGRDLTDKELGYLIWKVTYTKDNHFTVILDCCHSASGTRHSDEAKIRRLKSKRTKGTDEKIKWKQLFGKEDFIEKVDQITVPTGRHTLLSACRVNESAVEKIYGNQYRGVFTFCLVKALQQAQGNLSYRELINTVQAYVGNSTYYQHPQLESYLQSESGQFLNGAFKSLRKWHLIHHDNINGWVVHGGAIQGFESTESTPSSKLLIYEYSTPDHELGIATKAICELPVVQHFTTYATLKIQAFLLDKERHYKAVFSQWPLVKTKIALHPESDTDGANLFLDALIGHSSFFLEKTDHLSDCHYIIDAREGIYKVFPFGKDQLMFRPLAGYHIAMARQLVKDLETVAHWYRIMNLNNPSSKIGQKEIQIDFFEVIETSNDLLEVQKEKKIHEFLALPPTLSYSRIPADNQSCIDWLEPMFRLKITNRSIGQRYWFSLLILGPDFSISNQLLVPPVRYLSPGESVWAEFFDTQHKVYTSVIPLQILDGFREVGIAEIHDYFKLLVCTEEFKTDELTQPGVPFGQETYRQNSKRVRPPFLGQSDWRAFDFSVKVVRPGIFKRTCGRKQEGIDKRV